MTEHTDSKTTPPSQGHSVVAMNPLAGKPPVDLDQTLVCVNETGSPHDLLFRDNLNQDQLGWNPAAIGDSPIDLDSLVVPYPQTANSADLTFCQEENLSLL